MYRTIILGAAGRDFHDFQTFFRAHPEFRVLAFTAAQIPFIERRTFPQSLAGPGYDADIPIYSEERLPELLRELDIDFAFLSYSDLPYAEVMHKASIVQAAGASFALLGPKHTQLESRVPVVAVTAVRTGAGKSPLSQAVTRHLKARRLRVGVIRHPMPYGDLAAQAVQRFETPADLDRHECTVEEREEYAPYVEQGMVIFAGVDYAAILRAAEAEADVILWDGGNNDTPFIAPDLWITVVDPLRAGHEQSYYPGETNVRSADLLVVSKADQARPDVMAQLQTDLARLNPRAPIATAALELSVDRPESIAGKRVLVVEDGPTVTHGDMAFGAATLAAQRWGAKERIDPRPFAVGTIAEAFAKYPHLERVLPALGYSGEQRGELRETIEACQPDLVLDGSPAGIAAVLELTTPVERVRYCFHQLDGPSVMDRVDALLPA
jgi:predicted GTPase